jgi:hypothetical protein
MERHVTLVTPRRGRWVVDFCNILKPVACGMYFFCGRAVWMYGVCVLIDSLAWLAVQLPAAGLISEGWGVFLL